MEGEYRINLGITHQNETLTAYFMSS